MRSVAEQTDRRKIRHRRLRKKVNGYTDRPRLSVFRSQKHLYVQLIDDIEGKTLIGHSTKGDDFKKYKGGGNITSAKELGKLVAAEAKKQGINRVVFDRGGYIYHGRIKAFADAVREGGLEV